MNKIATRAHGILTAARIREAEAIALMDANDPAGDAAWKETNELFAKANAEMSEG